MPSQISSIFHTSTALESRESRNDNGTAFVPCRRVPSLVNGHLGWGISKRLSRREELRAARFLRWLPDRESVYSPIPRT
jgi:hypothetical protein